MLNSWPLAKDLQVLVEIVHSGSFSAAAATLGQTPAFVTKRIQILENTLATTLLNRSARGVALTESGQRCYEHALEILTQYQRLVDDVTQIKTRPEGMIRIGCSFGFGRSHIAPAITELMRNYPELQVHFELFDRQIDLVQDNIDLDIRISFGFGRSHIAPAITELMRNYPELQVHFELFDRQIDLVQDNIDLDIRINDAIPDYYIAHLLTKNKRILCAAPEYLQKYPQPQSLQELSRHDCLVTKERDMTHGIWELGNGQEKKSVKVSGHLSSNSGEIVLQWALEGKGIMLRSEWDVLPFLESGKLVRVLPEYAQSANIWAVYREPLYRSMKLRVCVEFLAAWCQQRLGKPDEGYQVM